jgi:hypothetical protein
VRVWAGLFFLTVVGAAGLVGFVACYVVDAALVDVNATQGALCERRGGGLTLMAT